MACDTPGIVKITPLVSPSVIRETHFPVLAIPRPLLAPEIRLGDVLAPSLAALGIKKDACLRAANVFPNADCHGALLLGIRSPY